MEHITTTSALIAINSGAHREMYLRCKPKDRFSSIKTLLRKPLPVQAMTITEPRSISVQKILFARR